MAMTARCGLQLQILPVTDECLTTSTRSAGLDFAAQGQKTALDIARRNRSFLCRHCGSDDDYLQVRVGKKLIFGFLRSSGVVPQRAVSAVSGSGRIQHSSTYTKNWRSFRTHEQEGAAE